MAPAYAVKESRASSVKQGDSLEGAGFPQWFEETGWLMVLSLKVVTMAAGRWLVG